MTSYAWIHACENGDVHALDTVSEQTDRVVATAAVVATRANQAVGAALRGACEKRGVLSFVDDVVQEKVAQQAVGEDYRLVENQGMKENRENWHKTMIQNMEGTLKRLRKRMTNLDPFERGSPGADLMEDIYKLEGRIGRAKWELRGITEKFRLSEEHIKQEIRLEAERFKQSTERQIREDVDVARRAQEKRCDPSSWTRAVPPPNCGPFNAAEERKRVIARLQGMGTPSPSRGGPPGQRGQRTPPLMGGPPGRRGQWTPPPMGGPPGRRGQWTPPSPPGRKGQWTPPPMGGPPGQGGLSRPTGRPRRRRGEGSGISRRPRGRRV